MEFLDLKDISERSIELVNPTSREKILRMGELAGLAPGQRVIDFGTGFAEVLALWGERFGVGGVGIDVRPAAIERGRRKLAERGLAEQVELVCGNAADYTFAPRSFHVAACIGATFIWGDFRAAVDAMAKAVVPDGRLLVGEVHWRSGRPPGDLVERHPEIPLESKLLEQTRAAGWEMAYALHSSVNDWDRYESANWQGLLQWLAENPDHRERDEVRQHLHESQDEYFAYGREHFGWALYLLEPKV